LAADAVLLDLDGTLVHTAPDLAESVDRMLADLGRPAVGQAAVEGWIGEGVGRLVKRALTGERTGEPEPALYERGYARFLEHYTRLVSARSRPYPGVREGLAALRAAGLTLACVTSKMAVFTHALLHDLGLADCFALVVAGDSLPRKKPDPLPLLHACAELGVEPARAVFVGDSPVDAEAARAAGVHFVGVTYGYRGGLEPADLGAERLIDSLAELPAHLGAGGRRRPRGAS
jgi:phosphoglycolate phosphatase